MKAPRKVRGLMGAAEAEANGEQWVMEEPSRDFVPGMGLGATKQATRWAWRGLMAEALERVQVDKRGRGQPRKLPKYTNDAKRAFILYATVEDYRIENGLSRTAEVEFSLKELIKRAEDRFPTHGIFMKPSAHNKMLASVKRGREILGIDNSWRGPSLQSLFNPE